MFGIDDMEGDVEQTGSKFLSGKAEQLKLSKSGGGAFDLPPIG